MDFRKFVFGETLEKAIEAIPEEYQLKYYRIVKNYGLHGIEPEKLAGFELSTWIQMKAMIDNTIPSRNNASPVGTKKRGAPFGNTNAQKKDSGDKTIEFNSENNLIQNNSENNSIQRLNVNVNGNENENVNANEGEIDFSNDPQELFIYIWQHTPGIFNAFGRIESPKEWDHFWATAPPTCEEVRAIMQNVIDDVKDGRQDPHFIAKTPDRFVLGGGFVRHKNRRKPDRKNSPPPSLAGKLSLGDVLDDRA